LVEVPVGVAVVQWVLLLTLAGLVLGMYRQLAHVLNLSRKARGIGAGLEPGASAPAFYYRVKSEEHEVQFVPGSGSATLLMFTDPRCHTCEQALEALEHVAVQEGDEPGTTGWRFIAATDSSPTVVEALGIPAPDHVPLVCVAGHVTAQYHVRGVPYTFVLDTAGTVRGHGAASTARELRRLMRLIDTKVPVGP